MQAVLQVSVECQRAFEFQHIKRTWRSFSLNYSSFCHEETEVKTEVSHAQSPMTSTVLFFPLINRNLELITKKGAYLLGEAIFARVHPRLSCLITTLLLTCLSVLVMNVNESHSHHKIMSLFQHKTLSSLSQRDNNDGETLATLYE